MYKGDLLFRAYDRASMALLPKEHSFRGNKVYDNHWLISDYIINDWTVTWAIYGNPLKRLGLRLGNLAIRRAHKLLKLSEGNQIL